MKRYTNIFKKFIDLFGSNSQLVMAIEEMSELQKVLCKYLNNRGKREDIIEEMSDVLIMMEQLKIIFDISDDEIIKLADYKTQRTLNKINSNPNNEFGYIGDKK